jgi:phage-related protein
MNVSIWITCKNTKPEKDLKPKNNIIAEQKDCFIYSLNDYISFYIIRIMKSLKFVGSSLDDLRNFPDEARRTAGFELFSIQCDLEPSDWKPMQSIGQGVREIRIHVLGEWRVIYVAKIKDAVYVLHSFQKKSRKTENRDIELARKRYKQIGG